MKVLCSLSGLIHQKNVKCKNVSLGSSLDVLIEGRKSEIDNIIVGAH